MLIACETPFKTTDGFDLLRQTPVAGEHISQLQWGFRYRSINNIEPERFVSDQQANMLDTFAAQDADIEFPKIDAMWWRAFQRENR